jgi:hypothetical protein
MAIAFYEQNVPFVLVKKNEMIRMIKGMDYIGIVPENATPRYCHEYFPEKDRIEDFINPWFDPELISVIRRKAIWYPLKEMEMEKN